jgi:glutamate racemase
VHPDSELPIGVFDSGIGGLTVLRALMSALPDEEFVYLGDTARLPYGTKTAQTVERYAVQAGRELVSRGIKCLVVACNTASSAALPALRDAFAPLPVLGVIEPGAQAAIEVTRSGRIGVLATEATVRAGAYDRAIRERLPSARVTSIPATLFVALAEEGWIEGEVADLTARRYLAELEAASGGGIDTLVLGCTHFPPFEPLLRSLLPPSCRLVDSAATTATAVTRTLLAHRRRTAPRALRLLATDGLERFARVGSRFLGQPVDAMRVERVDLL